MLNKNITIEEFCDYLFKTKSNLLSKSNLKSNIKNLLSANKINKNDEIISNPLFEISILRTIQTNSANFIDDLLSNYIHLDIISQGNLLICHIHL